MASLYGGGPNSSTTLDQLLAAAGITSAGLTGSTTAMPTQSALQLKSGRAMTPQTIIKGKKKRKLFILFQSSRITFL
jgi:hypothetical protein